MTTRRNCTICKHCYVAYSEELGEYTACDELAKVIDESIIGCDSFEQRTICGRCSHYAREMSIPFRAVCKAHRTIMTEDILECKDFEDEEELVLAICRESMT